MNYISGVAQLSNWEGMHGVKGAIRFLRKAIELEPDYVEAKEALAIAEPKLEGLIATEGGPLPASYFGRLC